MAKPPHNLRRAVTAALLLTAALAAPAKGRVVGRWIIYAGSPLAADSLDNAIATDKTPLLGGQTATFANYTGYSRGVNGLMIDIAGLRGDVTAEDFRFMTGDSNDLTTWTPAAPPTRVETQRGAGVGGSDRVILRWADGAVVGAWLAVITRPTAATGLDAADVFYVGAAPGETGDEADRARVTDDDASATAAHLTAKAAATNIYDHNRDGAVDLADVAVAAGGSGLTLLRAPATPVFNRPPRVSAGPDQAAAAPATVVLAGAADDDGLPAAGALTITWTVDSGPAPVAFTTDAAASTAATFNTPGEYVLRLTADDGAAGASDTVVVTVAEAPKANTWIVDANHPTADDGNAGSEDEPWRTVAHAVGQAQPGDTIFVKEGIYRETIRLTVSGSPGRPITLAGYPGHRAVLSGGGRLGGFAPDSEPAVYVADLSWRPASLHQDGVPLTLRPADAKAGGLDEGQWTVEDRGGAVWRVRLRPRDDADPADALIEGAPAADNAPAVIDLADESYWVLDNLEIRHGGGAGIAGDDDQSDGRVAIRRCAIHHNAGDGLNAAYNHHGTVRRCFIAHNGGDGVGMSGGVIGLVVEENEIAFNGAAGLRFGGAAVIIRRNFIHGHATSDDAANAAASGGARNVLFEANVFLDGSRQCVLENIAGVTFRSNVFAGGRADAIVLAGGDCADVAIIGNTFLFDGRGAIDTAGGDGCFLRNNIFVAGGVRPFWSVRPGMNFDSDYNLFHFADGAADTDGPVVAWPGRTSDRGLGAYVRASGCDVHSGAAPPLFANAPRAYVLADPAGLREPASDRITVAPADARLFVVGEFIELDWDGVVRTITAVNGDTVAFTPAEPRPPTAPAAVALWGDNNDFTLDLARATDSPALNGAADGGPLGSPVNIVQFARGDFDGDGVRDIPTWLENPAPRPVGGHLPGDANGDGVVNIVDFVTLKENLGRSPAAWADGDFNGDGRVDIADFIVLKNNFGSAAAPAPAPAPDLPLADGPAPPASRAPSNDTSWEKDLDAATSDTLQYERIKELRRKRMEHLRERDAAR